MNLIETSIPGVLIIKPKVFGDKRGYFFETWQQQRYTEMGLPERFVQDNLSFSRCGVLRGLHFQHPNDQGKLIYVIEGEVYDVAVDIRRGSPTFGQWTSVILSGKNRKQFYIPPGFAHGFCVLTYSALFSYKCTDFYNPAAEGSILWNDPDIGIAWPFKTPELSAKDQSGLRLRDYPRNHLPIYESDGAKTSAEPLQAATG